MKNIIRTYTSLLILLSLHYLSQVHATQHHQQGWWHESLAELYYKGGPQMDRRKTKDIIQTFEDIHSTHITNIQDIHSEIEPKMLDKKKFSPKKHELDVLTVFYLFKKMDNRAPLIQREIQEGYQALTELYYKGTSKKQENKLPIQQILIPKTIITNKKTTKHQRYALNLARYLNNHTTSSDKLQRSLPITVQQAPRYSNHHDNLTTQLHNLKTMLNKSPSNIALSQIDSLDKMPSLVVHTSDEEESQEDTEDDDSAHTSSPTTRDDNHDMHLQQIMQETKAHKNRLSKLNKLNKQLTTHSHPINNQHDQSLTCSDTNPEPHRSTPFTKQKKTIQNHHTPLPSLHDLHSKVLNQVHQKHKTSLNQVKEANRQLKDTQQIIGRLQQKIKNMQQEADQHKATIHDLKGQITDLQQKTKQPTTTSPNIINPVIAFVTGTIIGIAINRYILKAKQEKNDEQLVSGKEDNTSSE